MLYIIETQIILCFQLYTYLYIVGLYDGNIIRILKIWLQVEAETALATYKPAG